MEVAVERAYAAIREGIICGAYGPGDHLTADDLASSNGLSRTPVREALRRLHAEGLVRLIPHRGAFVTELDASEISKIYSLRVLLESHAAESAAVCATDAQLEQMEYLATRIDELAHATDTPAVEQIAEYNNRFHKLIVSAANSSRLESALSAIIEVPLVLRTFRHYKIAELRRSSQQHLELVSAIRARTPEWARSVMTSHILSAHSALLRSDETSTSTEKTPPNQGRIRDNRRK